MRRPRITTLLLTILAASIAPAQSTEEWSGQVLKALQRKQPFPTLGDQSYNVTERQAYEAQGEVVRQLVKAGDKIIGHKAGLTSAAAQARFDVFEPVAGTLLKSHVQNTGAFVSLRQYSGMVVEMEIGFELKLSIRSAVQDVAELKSKVRQVYPVVELPHLEFEPSDRITGKDIIASNVAAAVVIKGRAKPLDAVDLNGLTATLTLNGESIAEGRGRDAMGDQWEALRWLVNQRIREGYEVKRNEILITGSLGKVVPAQAGRYVADFGGLGRVTFSAR